MIQLNEYLINRQTRDVSHNKISESDFINLGEKYNLNIDTRSGHNEEMCKYVLKDKYKFIKKRQYNDIYPYFQLILHENYFSLNGMDVDDGTFPIYYYKNSHLDLIMNKPDNMDYVIWNGEIRFLYTTNNLEQLSKKLLDVYDSIK